MCPVMDATKLLIFVKRERCVKIIHKRNYKEKNTPSIKSLYVLIDSHIFVLLLSVHYVSLISKIILIDTRNVDIIYLNLVV